MKNAHKREYYIPTGATKVADKLSTAVAYMAPFTKRNGTECTQMVAFNGAAQKPALNFLYRDVNNAWKRIGEFFETVQYCEKTKREAKASRDAAPVGLEVGDVLRSSWGYDQTNIDYYEVTKRIGQRTVELRKIAARSIEDASMQGQCSPKPGEYIGEPFRKQARDGGVRIASYAHAFRVEPTVVAGVKTYSPDRWTAYA